MREAESPEQKKEMEGLLLVLFLANDAEPIRGRIMLVKQAFLIVKEIAPQLAKSMKFFPYLYGPYSNELAEMINELIDENYVETYKADGDYFYRITERGIEYANKMISRFPSEVFNKISTLKSQTQELGLSNVLKKVYREYPDYAVYSRGREVYGTS